MTAIIIATNNLFNFLRTRTHVRTHITSPITTYAYTYAFCITYQRKLLHIKKVIGAAALSKGETCIRFSHSTAIFFICYCTPAILRLKNHLQIEIENVNGNKNHGADCDQLRQHSLKRNLFKTATASLSVLFRIYCSNRKTTDASSRRQYVAVIKKLNEIKSAYSLQKRCARTNYVLTLLEIAIHI